MCGITGFSGRGFAAAHADAPAELERMSRTLRHRGPDDAGMWQESARLCGLAQCRLSIVDLSPSGHQPMESHCRRYVIVFNGEIYNHRELRAELDASAPVRPWRGTSDTETLLESIAQWGLQAALTRMDGMFAFGLWDRQQRTLTLARDRVGEKPLFYWHADGFLVFASEIKALLALPGSPRGLDRAGLVSYLNYGYVPGEGSMLAGVRRVPPASILIYSADRDRVRHEKYWHVPDLVAAAGATEEELTEMLRQRLARSVRLQMQADVPVAVLLSGGLDSSLVAAFAAETASRVKTFTIGFPNSGRFDERAHASIVARHFGTEHTEISLESSALDALERISQLQDEPLGDSSILPTYLVCQAVSRHVKVALGGDGGDELFGGYRAYNLAKWQQLARSGLPRFARVAIAGLARRHAPLDMKGRAYLTALSHSLAEAAARSLVLFDDDARQRLLQPGFVPAGFAPEGGKEVFVSPGRSVIQTVTRMDFHTYLPDDILAKVDRAAMMSSLEVRAPMLDRQVVELAFGRVPDRLKAGYRRRKILLRKLAVRVLPRELDLQRKQGFSIPLQSWLRTDRGAVLLEAAKALPRDVVQPAYIDKLIAAQRTGGNHAERIFCLAMLSFWMSRYRIHAG